MKKLPIIVLIALYGAFPADAAIAQEASSNWSDARVWVTGLGAFLGFFGATVVKHHFDKKLEARKEAAILEQQTREMRERRKQLAGQLLAELRYLSSDLIGLTIDFPMRSIFKPGSDLENAAKYLSGRLKHQKMAVFESSIDRLGMLAPETSSLVVDTFYKIRNIEQLANVTRENETNDEAKDAATIAVLHTILQEIAPKIDKLDEKLSNYAEIDKKTFKQLKKTVAENRDHVSKKYQHLIMRAQIESHDEDAD